MAEEEYDFDPWETSSGLPDRITVRLDNPHFGYDAQINNGGTCLFIAEGTIVAGADDGNSTEFNQFFTCGDGWEPQGKGGTRVVREDGKARKFNENANYARFFKSLLRAAQEQGLVDELRKRGTPFDAATWDGLHLYLEREEYSFNDRETGNKVERSRLVVKRIEKMGEANVNAKDTDTASVRSEAAQSTPAASAGEAGNNGGAAANGMDPKLKARLRALARECDNHNQFVERAFEVDGVLDNPAAEEAIMAATGDNSVWASVQEG